MQRNLATLADGEHDLRVGGGGMFGAAAALDAAQRGLKVALLERGDFCGATSAHSFKMIHGGIRYLQHADLSRLRQSARARSAFLRVAPHLTQPLPIVVPTYGWGMKSGPAMRAAMAVYDALTLDRNRGIADPSRWIPRGRSWGRDEVLRRYPGLAREGLTGAGVFCDGQMYNAPRLVLAFVQSATAAGAVCANHVEVTSFLRRGERVVGVVARDRLTGERLEVRARMVLNAAGPYAEYLLRACLGRHPEPAIPFSRDAYFIVGRRLLPDGHALTLPAGTSDPEAILSRGPRHLFLVPWRDVTLVGVWHKVFPDHPDSYAISEPELAAWLAEINGACGGLDLGLKDIVLGSAGLVPFGENDPNARHLKYGHRSRIIDHATADGTPGLLTVIGIRYTMAPVEAGAVVDLAAQALGRAIPPSRLEYTPVRGGEVDSMAGLMAEAVGRAPHIPTTSLESLVRNHGSCLGEVLAVADERPELARPLPGSAVLGAEIVHAARHEMALTLADAAFRRTDLCTAGPPADAALVEAARLMAQAAGWAAARRGDELERVRARLREARTGRSFLDLDPHAERVLVA